MLTAGWLTALWEQGEVALPSIDKLLTMQYLSSCLVFQAPQGCWWLMEGWAMGHCYSCWVATGFCSCAVQRYFRLLLVLKNSLQMTSEELSNRPLLRLKKGIVLSVQSENIAAAEENLMAVHLFLHLQMHPIHQTYTFNYMGTILLTGHHRILLYIRH